jgi:predicted nucleic acid-binding protein
VKVLFDTNVVLDLLLDREPWAQTAADLVARVEREEIEGALGATTITTIHYIAAKAKGSALAREQIRKLLAIFAIAPVNRPVLDAALELGMADFEDAVLCEAARQAGAEVIVTRDPKGFKKAVGMTILSPKELAEILAQRARAQD